MFIVLLIVVGIIAVMGGSQLRALLWGGRPPVERARAPGGGLERVDPATSADAPAPRDAIDRARGVTETLRNAEDDMRKRIDAQDPKRPDQNN